MAANQIGFGVATQARSFPLTLTTGQVVIAPSGQYVVTLGSYTTVQWYDPQTTVWRNMQTPANSDVQLLSSDGYNYRLANISGTVAGAYVTNGGSGYPNGIYLASSTTASQSNYVLATVSAAGAQSSQVGTLARLNVIVGGAVSTTVTVTTAGSGYVHAPVLQFSNPPLGGVPASGYVSALSNGGISTVVITNQGAGYTTAPTITVIPNPQDTTATGAVLTATLTNSGNITAVTLADGGSAYATTPTISFSSSAGSSGAASAVMCMSVTSVGSVSGGSANLTDNTASFTVTSQQIAASKTNAPVNPLIEQGLFTPRTAWGTITTSSGVASAMTVVDGGLIELVGTGATSARISPAMQWTTAAPTSTPTGTLAFGGIVDTNILTFV